MSDLKAKWASKQIPHKALFEAVSGSHDNWLEWTEGGDQELIEELIADGAKLNYYSKAGNNAFHEACSKGQLKSKSIKSPML